MKYFLHNGNKQTGPFTLDELRSIEQKNEFYVWHEKIDTWQPLESLFPAEKQILAVKAVSKPKRTVKRSDVLIALSLIGFVAALMVYFFFVTFHRKENVVRRLTIENERLKNGLGLTSYQCPILISSLTFKNGKDNDFNFDNEFNSHDTRYVYPVISFLTVYPHEPPRKIELFTRILDSDGKLIYNENVSPSGFTAKTDLGLKPDMSSISDDPATIHYTEFTLSGWGSVNPPSYQRGKYTVQVWYKGSCLKENSFTIL